MKSKLGHVYLYVSDLDKSYNFYKELLEYLDYKQIVKADWGFAFRNEGTSVWFEKARKGHVEKGFHRKRIGLNHLAFRVNSKREVYKFHKEFLVTNKIPTLYGTPKLFPEYEEGYYAVFFEDPDRIKLEVAYYS
jgi:catechol 2,3-dioxygenase-like lactoylglutathione lyase family enzyme